MSDDYADPRPRCCICGGEIDEQDKAEHMRRFRLYVEGHARRTVHAWCEDNLADNEEAVFDEYAYQREKRRYSRAV